MASGTVPAVGGDAADADCWVGMGIDKVVVRGEAAEMVMTGVEAGGTAESAVVFEFVSAEAQVTVL